jgi:hypothetical protein
VSYPAKPAKKARPQKLQRQLPGNNSERGRCPIGPGPSARTGALLEPQGSLQSLEARQAHKSATSHPSYPANPPEGEINPPPQHPGQACKLMGDVKSTGLGRDRLRSVDRNNKTTLLLTRRCGTNKSYAKDLSPRMVKLQDVS